MNFDNKLSLNNFLHQKLVRPGVLILYGPTGVGKSSCALELANYLPIEIVNGDTGQCYVPLTIGTAKPDWKNEPVKHHLFDTIDTPRNYTVAEYRTNVCSVVQEIWARGNLPVIVGGSGFYIKSLFYPVADAPINTHFESYNNKTTFDLWNELAVYDPERASDIDQHDRYRIERALSIVQSTGRKSSDYKPSYTPPFSYSLFFLTRDRQDLYDRINQRVSDMIDQGWIDEVCTLKDTDWEQFLYEKKFIGYDLLLPFCKNRETEEILTDTIVRIAQRTRNYAKRQLTFWRSFENQLRTNSKNSDIYTYISMLNLTMLHSTIYRQQIINSVEPFFR